MQTSVGVGGPVGSVRPLAKKLYGAPYVFYRRRFLLDAVSWWVAVIVATLIRYEGMLDRANWRSVVYTMLLASILQLIFGYILGVYRGRHTLGSFEGFIDVSATTILTTLWVWIYTVLWPNFAGVPRSLILIAAPIAIVLMAGTRYVARLMVQRKVKPAKAQAPVILYGAGYVGDHLARLLTTDTNSHVTPVGILDDDPGKRNLRLHGVRVVGSLEELPAVSAATGAKTLIVSIGDPSPELLEKVRVLASAAGMNVRVMPSVQQMLAAGVSASGLRDLDIEDLLGRPQVDTDVSAIADYLNGRRVLVTGAGGSIGQQLCVEINKHGPSELIMLDRDETGLQHSELRIRGVGLLDTNEVVLADIRDRATLKKLFKERKPDVVFHAAALKHLPMLEQYPDEAWQTNVLGTLNVLEAAQESGVQVLVNISTDKAANPTSVLGMSKRIAERLTSWAGDQCGLRYLSVRFGNVIGSRGSMLPTFRALIEEGKPLTVTHPDITRYFMTIPEACQLVLQAGAIGRVGEVLILDMGEPVRILDIAEKMIVLSGRPTEIIFTGLREGEKLHEDLHGQDEVEVTPFHEKISHAPVGGLEPARMSKEVWDGLIEMNPVERPDAVRDVEGADARAQARSAEPSQGGADESHEVSSNQNGVLQ